MKMRCKTQLFLFGLFIIFLLNSTIVLSTRISPGKIIMDFEPNTVQKFDFLTGGAPNIKVSGSAGYGIKVEISELEDYGDDKRFTVTITLPDSMPIAGDRLKVGVISAAQVLEKTTDTIATKTVVLAPIFLNVPYPGVYAIIRFDAPNVNVNETIKFHVLLENKGKLGILKANVRIDIYSFAEFDFDNKISTLTSETKRIEGRKDADFYLYQNTTGWDPGEYKAVATIFYDDNQTILERFFNIGSLNILITNYTKEVFAGQINRFDIKIESKWNNLINNIYGEVTINGTTFKTPGVELNPWTKEILSGYWDTTNVIEGEYDASIRVFYSGQTKTEKGVVKVITPKKEKKFLSTTTILIGVIILLILLDIIIVYSRKRMYKKKKSK